MTTDFIVENHGSVALLHPQTEAAHAWIAANIVDPNALRFGDAVVIEPRYVDDIVRGIVSDGLTVEGR